MVWEVVVSSVWVGLALELVGQGLVRRRRRYLHRSRCLHHRRRHLGFVLDLQELVVEAAIPEWHQTIQMVLARLAKSCPMTESYRR